MLFQIYELRPGFSPTYNIEFISTSSEGYSYSIVVGVRNRKPTNRDRERIENQIRAAWETLFDPQGWKEHFGRELWAPPYGLAIVSEFSPPAGETEPPPFAYNSFYIVFALLESESNSEVSDEEERATHEAILAALIAQYAQTKIKPRIALVTLYNCSVRVLEGPGPDRKKEAEDFYRKRGYW